LVVFRVAGGRLPEFTPQFIATAVTSYIVLLFSLSVHESAHGWMAYRMGDDTAMAQGRVTLNPIVHIDPIGTVLMPLLQFVSAGIPLLAWAKPTPVGAHNFKNLGRGHILVAGAGPASNLILAALFTGLLYVAYRIDGVGPALLITLQMGVFMNLGLAIFNMIPLPPLDGSWIASWGLPRHIAQHYDRVMEPYGSWILLLLFATGILGKVTRPLIALGYDLVELIVL
jgi:Zn-dependent protease